MAKEAGRLAQLSQNTLLLSKLEHMEVFRKKEEFRLDSQIRDCAILLLPSFEEKNILLEAELPEMKFYGSEEFMKEVWVNLLLYQLLFLSYFPHKRKPNHQYPFYVLQLRLDDLSTKHDYNQEEYAH